MSTIERTIACEDCGHQVVTKRANTKYCSVCRLVRDLPYVSQSNESSVCRLCLKEFLRLEVRDVLCGECAPPTSTKHGLITCVYCHQEASPVRREVPVCKRCARDPELRAKFFGALKRKQQERLERNRTGGVPA